MDYKDYYKVMGVGQNADEKEIKMAYRRLARKYHPDLSKEANAEEKFKEVGEAYEVLKDPDKRKVYDQYAKDWEMRQKAQSSGGGHSWGNASDGSQYQYSDDFFESLFGAAPHFRNARPRPGADFRGSINISLEDAYSGAVRELQLPNPQGGKPITIKVKIPAGVKSGQQIRLAGKGGVSAGGGASGDLYLTIQVNKHSIFDVMGNDIYITLPVAPWEVALGTTVVVPTLGGKVDLKIPSGSQGGQTLRLKHRGLPGKTSGDQYIILKIIIPQPTTEAQKALYAQMAKDMPFNPREKMGV